MFDEREIEAGELTEAATRERAIARIRGALEGGGAGECAACGELIPAARRQALPSAERCVTCQTKFERGGR